MPAGLEPRDGERHGRVPAPSGDRLGDDVGDLHEDANLRHAEREEPADVLPRRLEHRQVLAHLGHQRLLDDPQVHPHLVADDVAAVDHDREPAERPGAELALPAVVAEPAVEVGDDPGGLRAAHGPAEGLPWVP